MTRIRLHIINKNAFDKLCEEYTQGSDGFQSTAYLHVPLHELKAIIAEHEIIIASDARVKVEGNVEINRI